MKFLFEKKNGVLLITPEGRLVASNAAEFKTLTQENLRNHPECRDILCDCSAMTHIDSSGLGAMVFLLQHMKKQGGTMKLANLLPRARMVFDFTKVYRVFEIFDTAEEALASFGE